MTDQKLTASTVADFKQVFEQASQAIGSFGIEGNDAASRLARTLSRRIDERILDEMECLRALVAEREREQA